MKKYLLTVAALLCVVSSAQTWAAEGTAASATVASDYNWRGISFNNYSGAAVQGDMNFTTSYGLTAGMWAGNIAFPGNYFGGYEFDPYLSYAHSFGDAQVYAMFMYYYFAKNSHANSIETTVGVKWKDLHFSVGSIPRYFSFETSYMYYSLSYSYNVMEKIWLVPTLGHAQFNERITGIYDDYTHYKIGVQYRKDNMTLEMAFSTSDRETNTTATTTDKSKDDATIVSLTVAL